jgi:hypothetical protein
MREIRTSGSEGGGCEPNRISLPLSYRSWAPACEAVSKSAGAPQISRFVVPAKAGIQGFSHLPWAPACAGATIGEGALITVSFAGVPSLGFPR